MNYWLSTSDSVGDGRNCELLLFRIYRRFAGGVGEENRFVHAMRTVFELAMTGSLR